jgi:hypothetical protein
MTVSGWNRSTKWISLCILAMCWWSVLWLRFLLLYSFPKLDTRIQSHKGSRLVTILNFTAYLIRIHTFHFQIKRCSEYEEWTFVFNVFISVIRNLYICYHFSGLQIKHYSDKEYLSLILFCSHVKNCSDYDNIPLNPLILFLGDYGNIPMSFLWVL